LQNGQGKSGKFGNILKKSGKFGNILKKSGKFTKKYENPKIK
jgi:hypothetical protein